MKNKINRIGKIVIAFTLCTSLVCGTGGVVIAQSSSMVQQTSQLLGIINGDENGNVNLSAPATRAEFSKMMVSSSLYKDTTGDLGYTLFADVSSNHWASPYIKIAVEQGWMMGYLDGNFYPNASIKLEEGVSASLSLLGYNSSTLKGPFPTAHISKFNELGLNDNINATVGQALTINDCMNLFYNLMSVKNIEGVVYAQTLGYPLNTSGELDTVKLVSLFTEGPYTVESSGYGSLPFPINADTTIYRNDNIVDATNLKAYDICYYSEEINTVWAYNDRISGRLTAINSPESPYEIIVAGTTFALTSDEVAHKFAPGGEFSEGDFVTLLLGQSREVADVISARETESSTFGVVLSSEISVYPSVDGTMKTDNTIKVGLMDGTIAEYGTEDKNYPEGKVISINTSNGKQTIKSIGGKSIEGKVNSTATEIGEYDLASDIQILEVHETSFQKVYPSRLANYTIDLDDVLYHTKNAFDEIDALILEDTTGDLYSYGMITSAKEVNTGTMRTGKYSYIIDGKPSTSATNNDLYYVSSGGGKFEYENGILSDIENLKYTSLSEINSLSAKSGHSNYHLADNVDVYEYDNGNYFPVSLESVSNLDEYELTGYYDDFEYSAGKQIRVIKAMKK